jgi:toxin-antitoxin system PIN domain toxin
LIAVDSNILIYAHRRDSPHHRAAADRLKRLAEGRAAWALPWPCLHEFFSIVTHPRIYTPASTVEEALGQIETWRGSPSLVLIAETERHWPELRALVAAGRITGPRIHDARIAALCQQHGVRELWSADRDFSRFPGFRAVNPLVG